MINQEQIENNKLEFLKLVSEINNEKVDTEGLVSYLLETDFFVAPASTKYGCSYEGGLVEHTLNVYHILDKLVKEVVPNKIIEQIEEDDEFKEVVVSVPKYTDDQIILTALLHDLSKVNFYEKYTKSIKQFINDEDRDNSSKFDNFEHKWFNWVNQVGYKVKESEDRDPVGSRNLSAIMALSKFIPVFDNDFKEVTLAILNQFDGSKEMDPELKNSLKAYPLVTLLHTADLLACYIKDYE